MITSLRFGILLAFVVTATPLLAAEKLTEAEVAAWYSKLEAATKARNVDEMLKHFDPECSIVMAQDGQTTQLDFKTYSAQVREIIGNTRVGYEYSAVRHSITVDGARAVVRATVTEQLKIGDVQAKTSTQETLTVEKRGDRILIVKVEGIAQSK